MSGNNKHKIRKTITKALNKKHSNLTITPKITPNGELTVALRSYNFTGEPNLLFVRFFKRKETIVKSGENRGENLANYNIVNHWSNFNDWDKKSLIAKKQVPALLKNESCAALLQDRITRQIYAAGLCRSIPKP